MKYFFISIFSSITFLFWFYLDMIHFYHNSHVCTYELVSPQNICTKCHIKGLNLAEQLPDWAQGYRHTLHNFNNLMDEQLQMLCLVYPC